MACRSWLRSELKLLKLSLELERRTEAALGVVRSLSENSTPDSDKT